MERPLTEHIKADGTALPLKEYEQVGGYQAVRKALRDFTPKQVTETVGHANLRGRGGAGFATAMKWGFVPMGDDAPHPKYLVVNADEMEPGTFKDRLLLETHPHQLLEGIIVSAYAIQADVAYIFLRWAYKVAEQRLAQAIAEARAAGYLGKNILGSGWSLDLYLHVSAGRYMCGEETGLLNSLEGKRATPRAKPPFPPVSGLWGKPTVVNNVETLANVPHIINRGAGWYVRLSRTKNGGTKLYGVSGHVKKPGLWELPMGTTVREILEEHAGGMREGFRFRGVIPGGASTNFLVEEHLDVPMDFEERAESRQSSGHRHDDRARRPNLPGGDGREHGTILCPGIVRLVHALSRRSALDCGHAPGHRGRPRRSRRPRNAPASHQTARPGQHVLCAGPGCNGTAARAL